MRPLPIGEGPPTDGAAAAYAPPIIASNWRPIRRNTLIGSADLHVRKWRFTFYGALWHRKGEREWISLPAREWTGADGKRVFSALSKFSSHGDARRFSETAIEAIKRIAGEDAARGEAAQVKISGLAAPPIPTARACFVCPSSPRRDRSPSARRRDRGFMAARCGCGAMTAIQWTEKTWNPVVGCSVISPGCTHCYAMRHARRLAAISTTRDKYADLTIETKAGPVWNGKLRFWEANLLEPLGWKRPAMVFVNSMSDLAHHAMPVEWFERIWRVMVEARRANGHIFQVLTKRPENLLKLLAAIGVTTPEPGIWLGVSAETQLWWEARVPVLRDLPTEVPWASAEPQLGPIRPDLKGVRWIVQGGESGRKNPRRSTSNGRA
jgi:protein gp37